jgi:hypothetical protein
MSTSTDILKGGTAVAGGTAPADKSRLFLIAGIVLIGLSLLGLLLGNAADPARPFLGWILGISASGSPFSSGCSFSS